MSRNAHWADLSFLLSVFCSILYSPQNCCWGWNDVWSQWVRDAAQGETEYFALFKRNNLSPAVGLLFIQPTVFKNSYIQVCMIVFRVDCYAARRRLLETKAVLPVINHVIWRSWLLLLLNYGMHSVSFQK